MDTDAPVEDTSPAPEPESAPEPERTFPEKVVTDLRQEAARYRTERNVYRDAFEGFEPAEQEAFLNMVTNLREDPDKALEQFRGVSDRLAKQLGKETPVETEPTPTPEPTPEAAPAVTAESIQQMVAEGVKAVLDSRDAEAAQRKEIDDTLAQAETLGFTSPDQKAQLFAKAQEMGVGLEEAATAISGSFQSALDEAVAEALKGMGIDPEAAGNKHPQPTPTGDSTNPQQKEAPRTLNDADAAAEAFLMERFGR